MKNPSSLCIHIIQMIILYDSIIKSKSEVQRVYRPRICFATASPRWEILRQAEMCPEVCHYSSGYLAAV